jgi:DNA-binding XRE family transcriptional regulator
MKIYYDKEIDYAEIFFNSNLNYGEDVQPGIIVFKDEDSDKIVGYAFENASRSILNFEDLPIRFKIAFILKKTRESEGYTQEQIAEKLLNVSERQYQRAEAGENITLDVLDQIMKVMPSADFSKVFEKFKKAS